MYPSDNPLRGLRNTNSRNFSELLDFSNLNTSALISRVACIGQHSSWSADIKPTWFLQGKFCALLCSVANWRQDLIFPSHGGLQVKRILLAHDLLILYRASFKEVSIPHSLCTWGCVSLVWLSHSCAEIGIANRLSLLREICCRCVLLFYR